MRRMAASIPRRRAFHTRALILYRTLLRVQATPRHCIYISSSYLAPQLLNNAYFHFRNRKVFGSKLQLSSSFLRFAREFLRHGRYGVHRLRQRVRRSLFTCPVECGARSHDSNMLWEVQHCGYDDHGGKKEDYGVCYQRVSGRVERETCSAGTNLWGHGRVTRTRLVQV